MTAAIVGWWRNRK
ncbi:hypothetical protein LAY26_24665 [Escherichia coli]|nr:hypothetical protein [Escherichia coli]MDD8869732.1 hypothetical protein [Escherichia coli]